ncbi:hypothetical protein PoB_004351600 [Plakobranchus ocellatus]|uniref:Uncharacterized protein n=1 Tax=Plakobranchus ocellatus TaxID=259542 RepID=A0AAV4BDX9_9GAST|nr:hypothetical protein PoB_004351600 [Plakobranchus ocellatus]
MIIRLKSKLINDRSNNVILGFQALPQAKASMARLEPTAHRFLQLTKELNFLVSVWLSADGRANLRRIPYRFQAEFALNCATLVPRLCKETAPLHKIAAWWHSRPGASDRECDKPRWQPPFDPVSAVVESRPSPS